MLSPSQQEIMNQRRPSIVINLGSEPDILDDPHLKLDLSVPKHRAWPLGKSNTFFFNNETCPDSEYKSSAGGSFQSLSEQLVGPSEEEALKIDL